MVVEDGMLQPCLHVVSGMVSKKKSSNPIDAHRKAARARELKKNREKRKETREVTLVKKDTRGIEKEIRALQEKKTRSDAEKEELAVLQAECQRIKEAKEEYLAKNPEHRKFVYPREAEEQAEQVKRQQQQAALESRRRNQPLRDPRRSVYYHEIFNPHGAPPPGMPYMDKSAEQWEAEQRQEFERMAGQESEGSDGKTGEESEEIDDESDDDDEDIALPEGPPPSPPAHHQGEGMEEERVEAEDGGEDSSADEDGIVMPKGPPPAPPSAPRAMLEGLPTAPSGYVRPPLPPPPPLQFRPHFHQGPSIRHAQHPLAHFPMPRSGSASVHTAPSVPGHLASSLPSAPGPPPPRPAIVITSAPVLRDLKKEATAFVPTAIRRRQAAQKAKASKGGLPSAVNAAPSESYDDSTTGPLSTDREEEAESAVLEEKVDLMTSLRLHSMKRVQS
ncbi:hypothetical protein CBS101457_006461 [Exobasidium rhododendri]|nr:hypothetical protein CBS101457_006461 [Exobasidium rhododendri]